VLARPEGAGSGTKGLSMFIVPKFLVNDDGTLGERNGIFCTNLEKKMGLKASATCEMTMGDSKPCGGLLVGNVHGRFYLNLSEFMRIAAQVPWLDPRTLVELGGGSGGDELATQIGDVSHKRFIARLPLTASRLLREQLRLDEHVSKFEDEAERALRDHNALDLAILPDDGVGRKFRDVQMLLERTGDVMLTCASSALGTHVLLKGVLARVEPGGAERLAHDLTRGIRDLESARPAIGIMRIVSLARRDPPARAVLYKDGATLDSRPELMPESTVVAGPVRAATAMSWTGA